VCFPIGLKHGTEHVEGCSQIHHDQLDELSICLLIILPTFAQFQLQFLNTCHIVLNHFKGMQIKGDQLFLHLHNLAFIDFVKQRLQLLPNFMRKIDLACIKVNFLRDISRDDLDNLIFLPVNDKIYLVMLQILNRGLRILQEPFALHQSLHIKCSNNIIELIHNNKINLGIHL
jgi:hypothetical protein